MPRFRASGFAVLLAFSLGSTVPALGESILHTRGRDIVDADKKPQVLRGLNLGGLFVMEPFMTPMDRTHRLRDSDAVIRTLTTRFGRDPARHLVDIYEESWIDERDIAQIARQGLNAVRIPVWWGQFLDLDDPTPSGLRDDGFAGLDRVIDACQRHGIVAVIDMHGVVGGQSDNPDTGQAGRNRFWSDAQAQATTAWLWQRIAEHYRGNTAVAGYDLINEPAPPRGTPKDAVWGIYDRLYRAIRAVDPEHMIFIEDTFGSWSLDMLPSPRQFGWANVVYESHVYPWQRNHPGMPQPDAAVEAASRAIRDLAEHAVWDVPGYIGEFNGLNAMPGAFAAMVRAFDTARMSWTAWTYKSSDNGQSMNYWGWIEPTTRIERPDPARDDAWTIEHDWQGWRTDGRFSLNPSFR